MNTIIDLMKSHSSVRRFKEEDIKEDDLQAILTAGQMASSWKNFQSYSIILVRSQEKKEALYQFVPQEAIRQCSVFLLFVGDLNRAEKGVRMHTDQFHPEGPDNLLITSVDAALAGQNTLLAAESLGYGGVIIGLVRYEAAEVAKLHLSCLWDGFRSAKSEPSCEAPPSFGSCCLRRKLPGADS